MKSIIIVSALMGLALLLCSYDRIKTNETKSNIYEQTTCDFCDRECFDNSNLNDDVLCHKDWCVWNDECWPIANPQNK